MDSPILFITSCSRNKRRDNELLPAVKRYKSSRITWVCKAARASGAQFRSLSGKYGLITAGGKIPYYDQRLEWGGIKGILAAVRTLPRRTCARDTTRRLPLPGQGDDSSSGGMAS